MHIFCRETQAHLDLNPHLVSAASTSNLITPDLWLKNCRSRSASPNSERSGSPENATGKPPEKPEGAKTRKSPLPLITVAPTAKLMKPKATEEKVSTQKSPEAKKDLRHNKVNLRKRRTSKCSATVTSQTVRQHSTTPKAQDLRMCSPNRLEGPSPSSMGSSAKHSPTHPINPHPMPPPFPNPLFGMPAPVFMDNMPHMDQRIPNMFPPRPNFMPRSGIPLPQERPRFPLPFNVPQPLGSVPPVTVLVPYPVVLPIPLPIPIPIPMSAFVQAHFANKVKTEARCEDNEGPLDFTMNSDKNKQAETNSVETNDNTCPVENKEHTNEVSNETNDRIEEHEQSEEVTETVNPEQTLPKFKITRLGNKMAKIVTKAREPAESTRPLRKRRRLVEISTDDEALLPKTRKIVQV